MSKGVKYVYHNMIKIRHHLVMDVDNIAIPLHKEHYFTYDIKSYIDRYLFHSSVAENLTFGAPNQNEFSDENLSRSNYFLKFLKTAQVASAGLLLVGSHPAYVIGVLLDEVGVQVSDSPPHFIGVLLIDTEYDCLAKTVVLA